jgi:MHS family proline/betaine transporter-like MFS transporter
MSTEASTTSPEAKLPTVSMKEVRKVAIASLLGTSLEFYDFLLYGFVATAFAVLFFPSSNPTTALLAVLATFAVGYVARPVGAILFGHLGDRWGRRNSFVTALVLMALASLLTAVLPTYESIGILAPLFLVTLRLLQGLSVGGELGPGITIIGEYASKERRGFWVLFTQISQFFGPFLATISVLILSLIMTHEGFIATGWRWLFGVGALIGVIGGISQYSISESPLFKKEKEQKVKESVPVIEYFTKYWRTLLKVLGFAITGTVVIYLIGVFAIVYLETIVKTSIVTATLIISLGYVAGMIVTPFAGLLGDKVGRRKVYIAALIGVLIFIYPYYRLLSSGTFALMAIAQIIMVFIFSWSLVSIVILPELFPTRLRTTGVALSYNINTAAFGGTTPYIATSLIYALHSVLAPIIWGVVAIVISLLTMTFLIRETRGIDLDNVK